MSDKRPDVLSRVAEALRGKPTARALIMAERHDFLRYSVLEAMMRDYREDFVRANLTQMTVGHKDGGVVSLVRFDALDRIFGARFDIAVVGYIPPTLSRRRVEIMQAVRSRLKEGAELLRYE